MSPWDRAGDCVVKRLDDGQISVTQADPVIDVSRDLLNESPRDEHFAWNGRLMALDAVEGVVMYRAIEWPADWGFRPDYIRMERVA